MRTLLFLSLSLSLVACGDDDGRPVDSGTGVDSGPITPTDGGGTDTGTGPGTDSGTGVDSGMMMSGMCPAGACNIESGAGCPAGEGCYYDSMEAGGAAAPLCAPAGSGMAGASCNAPNDCREGHICIKSPGGPGTPGECRQVCCGGSTDACAVGDVCLSVDGSDEVGVCETPAGCNIIEQSGCSDGLDCVLLMGDGTTGCRDIPDGAGMQGAACAEAPCAAGFLCLRLMPDAAPLCLRACNPMMDMCAEGLVCARLTDSLGGCTPEG
jgi:hypothetical protein